MSSGAYGSTDGDGRDGTSPADASVTISTDDNAHDGTADAPTLPEPTTELFVAAGAVVAEGLAREDAGPERLEEALQRVVDQCVALNR